MLAVFPECLQQALDTRSPGNFDVFVVEADDVSYEKTIGIDSTKDLHVSRQRCLVERVGSFQGWSPIDHRCFEDDTGDMPNLAGEFGADAKARGFRKLSDDPFYSFDVKIAR